MTEGRSWALGLAALVAAGCDPVDPGADTAGDTGGPLVTEPDPSGACAGGGVGTLDVRFGDPGAGPWVRPPEVRVFDAAGAPVATLPASDVLPDLPGGDYVVEVHRGEGAPGAARIGDVVAPDQPLVRVCVGDGLTTAVDVAWTARAGRVRVSSGESIVGYGAADLDAGGDRAPLDRLDATLVNDFRGLDVARTGHVWAATSPTYGTRLLVWDAADLDGASAAAPLQLGSPVFADFAEVSDVAFGEDGTLWVALRQPGGPFAGLVGFSRATLAEVLLGGVDAEVAPEVQRPVDGIVGRVDLEIGPDGAVWIADYDNDRLLRIDDPRDGGTGADAWITAGVARTDGGDPDPLYGPENLAFDDAGDAVVFYWVSGRITRLPGAALAGDGEIDVVVSTDAQDVLQLPTGLVIDGVGDAWLGNYAGDGSGELLRWDAGDGLTPWLRSPTFPDPADVILDPRPR